MRLLGLPLLPPTACDDHYCHRDHDGRYHVTCVKQATKITLLVGGQPDSERIWQAPLPTPLSHELFTLGALPSGAAQFDGDMSDLRVWTVARSQEQLFQYMPLSLQLAHAARQPVVYAAAAGAPRGAAGRPSPWVPPTNGGVVLAHAAEAGLWGSWSLADGAPGLWGCTDGVCWSLGGSAGGAGGAGGAGRGSIGTVFMDSSGHGRSAVLLPGQAALTAEAVPASER